MTDRTLILIQVFYCSSYFSRLLRRRLGVQGGTCARVIVSLAQERSQYAATFTTRSSCGCSLMLLSSRLVGSGSSFVIDLADLDLWCDGALQSVGASLRRV